jgi:catechol 2,3-dioxygenase-like lactoylglutathione lyase family enzyme
MSRVQLALNVSDIDSAVEFYTRLFGVEPAKRRPGYANFAVTEPALKLVLLQSDSAEARGAGVTGALNHLGVEVESTDEVAASVARLSAEGLATQVQDATTCCYAVQDKVWVHDPDGAPWEVYTVLSDAPLVEGAMNTDVPGGCCAPGAVTDTLHDVPAAEGRPLISVGAASDAACC